MKENEALPRLPKPQSLRQGWTLHEAQGQASGKAWRSQGLLGIMQLRPYDLDALTRAVCAHMVHSGIDVVMVDEGIIRTPGDRIIQIAQADVENKTPPSALAEMFACVLKARTH